MLKFCSEKMAICSAPRFPIIAFEPPGQDVIFVSLAVLSQIFGQKPLQMLRKQSSGLELTLNRSKLLKTPVFKRGIVFQVMHLQDLLGKYWNSGSVVLSCGHIQRCFKKYKKLNATTWQLHGNQALQWKIYRWKRSIHAPSMEEQCSTVQPTAVPSVGWLQGVRISNIKIWVVQLSIRYKSLQPSTPTLLISSK